MKETKRNYKNYKYIIGMFLLAFLLIGLAKGVDAKATSGKCGKNVKWTYKNGTLTISGKGAMKNYKYIKEKWKDSDAHVNSPWYMYEKNVKKIIIKNGVTSVGDYAFCTFEKVKKVSIGKNVKTIGRMAFFCCNMQSLEFPDSLTTIGDSAFANCDGFKKLVIGKNVKTIGKWAFFSQEGGLREIVIPEVAKKIGDSAFYGQIFLKKVTVESKNVKWGKKVFWYGTKVKGLTLYGYDDSTTEKFAKKNGIQFSALDDDPGVYYINVNRLEKTWMNNNSKKVGKQYFALGSLDIKKGTATIKVAGGFHVAKVYIYNQSKKKIKGYEYQPYNNGGCMVSVNHLKKNKIYYYRIRTYIYDAKKKKFRKGSWSDYRAFTTADYKYMVTSKTSLAAKTPKIKGIKNYSVYISAKKTSGYKKIKTVKPGKIVKVTKYKGKKLKKNKNYYIKFVAKTKKGVTCDAAVYRYKTQK